MKVVSRRSPRSGRAPSPSPGRPSATGRDEQNRFWKAIATGQSSEDAALEAGLSQPVGSRLFRKAGGMPPAMFRSSGKPLSGRYLSLAEREEIAREGRLRSMAKRTLNPCGRAGRSSRRFRPMPLQAVLQWQHSQSRRLRYGLPVHRRTVGQRGSIPCWVAPMFPAIATSIQDCFRRCTPLWLAPVSPQCRR